MQALTDEARNQYIKKFDELTKDHIIAEREYDTTVYSFVKGGGVVENRDATREKKKKSLEAQEKIKNEIKSLAKEVIGKDPNFEYHEKMVPYPWSNHAYSLSNVVSKVLQEAKAAALNIK